MTVLLHTLFRFVICLIDLVVLWVFLKVWGFQIMEKV